MAIKTQGTQLYALVPSTTNPGSMEVLEIKKVSNFNGGGAPADQITLEYLEAFDREYLKGLRTPSAATFTVDADPREPSHVWMYEAANSNDEAYDKIRWAAGWSDGYGIAPTVNSDGDDFELPNTRTWFVFTGNVQDFPFDFQTNTVVKTQAAIQRSGPGKWQRKGATQGQGESGGTP